ncbi:uncharacterized protein LOC143375106 [Andrena cerasifolii]|uniref:uncharacterized protein LOC143375106 n=1 Tax=Andrena cerasifolii TaxID=2819439 RepID=UPI0040382AFE
MLRRTKVKSTTRISQDRRGKSATSDNLYVSPSLVGKFQKFATRKQKSDFSKSCPSASVAEEWTPGEVAKEAQKLATSLPKDAAVHFGNFYGVHGSSKKLQPGKVTSSAAGTAPSFRVTPRLEFTRQMVQKLERTAGTEEYARQVSALLDETVEPPHFKPHSLPAENSIPDGRHNPSGYPLWYKDPYKMPFTSDEVRKLFKEECDDESKMGTDVFEEGSEGEYSYEGFSDDEQAGENESPWDARANDGAKGELSLLNISSRSSATEAKDTDSKESDDGSASDSKNDRISPGAQQKI